MKRPSTFEIVHISCALIGVFMFANDMTGSAWGVVCVSLFSLMLWKIEDHALIDAAPLCPLPPPDPTCSETAGVEKRSQRKVEIARVMMIGRRLPNADALHGKILCALDALQDSDEEKFRSALLAVLDIVGTHNTTTTSPVKTAEA